ncbi:bifunctional oligoribonuclease/PAP phosphatase NrnA [Marinilongibacter aquaticus]|uniref:DHH family phosphoesterase n=1 Tax=Marinilongibacter aquaticus TaxID=2975157 RepID=UPI0021BD5DD0|nr:bifunctional oligoribonuclease/PAP phosphatase NrnA [Marinilongibacter aquaticus]UBM57615.1 bifunctional oligoribonuclease/PAP phosphatase NrnA [Marinilongibacter aquaticus]
MNQFFTQEPKQKQEFLSFLSEPRRIVLTSHQNPDGDAFGSIFSLYALLKGMGHQVHAISPTGHASFLAWLPGVEEVVNFEDDLDRPRAVRIANEAEMIFCLDFSALNRVKDFAETLAKASAKKVLVDHHQEPEGFADYIFWEESASSTCELIYRMIVDLGWQENIDKDVATCLYTGILTDTGSFKFESTTRETHCIAGELIEKGIRPDMINRKLFDQNSLSRTRFLGYALSEKLTVLEEYGLAYFVFSKSELDRFAIQKGDTEGIVNYGLSVAGIGVSVIFIEKEDGIRMSFRSVDDFSVSAFAREHFNGGGHKNAAGGRSSDSLEATVKRFLEIIPQYKSEMKAVSNK